MRFGIRSLFVATLLAACVVYAYQTEYVSIAGAVIGINLLGVAAGWIVTKLLRFPIDGGYRDPAIRAEFGQNEAGQKYSTLQAPTGMKQLEQAAKN